MLVFGPYEVTPASILSILTGSGSGTSSVVILSLRLPRVITAIVSGWGLAFSGAVMQAVLRNPLGSPFALGISNGAGFTLEEGTLTALLGMNGAGNSTLLKCINGILQPSAGVINIDIIYNSYYIHHIYYIIKDFMMATKLLSTTIDELLAKRLEKLAAETHRKKSYFVNEALKNYFEEIEDYEIAHSRRGGKAVSLKDAKKELNL